jgi:electron transport complex protein RnfG
MAVNRDNAKKIVSLGLVLFTVTAITGLILGIVNEITAEPIRITKERLKEEALAAALPDAENFSEVELAPESDPILKDAQEGKKEGALVGYCVTVTPSGYGGPIEIVVGIKESGQLGAIRILNMAETPGLGAKAPLPAFSGQYDGKEGDKLVVVKNTPDAGNQIQAISGATITSEAVTLGVNTAIEYWKNHLSGGN